MAGRPVRRSAVRFLVRLARAQLGQILGGVLLGIACTMAQALVPPALGQAVDDGVVAGDTRALLGWAAALLALAVVQAAAGVARDRYAVASRLRATLPVVEAVTEQVCRLGAGLRRRATTGEVVSVGVVDLTNLGVAFSRLSRGVGAAVAVVTIAVLMLRVSWQLGLVILAGVPTMAWAMTRLIRALHRRQTQLRHEQGRLTSRALDVVGSLHVLRGIGGEAEIARRYRADSARVRHAAVRAARVEALLAGAKVLLPGLLTALVAGLGAALVATGRFTGGEVVTFYTFSIMLVGPLRWLTLTADGLTKGHVAAGRIAAFLALEPASADSTDGEQTVAPAGGPLVDPVSGLVVPPGTVTAVVCETTDEAVVLAERLGRYAESEVTLGGVPLRDLPLREVRRRILVARNDDRLFAGTLRAQLDPDGAAVTAPHLLDDALDAASARGIVAGLPDGLDHPIAPGGRGFSGGEQQRLRLVRALMADPEVLVLVEPTCSLDAHTEVLVAGGLRAHRAGRSTVVFTTSPILLGHADRVVLVASGRVWADGDPKTGRIHLLYRERLAQAGTP